MNKNVLKLICLFICSVLLTTELVYIARLNDFERDMAARAFTAATAEVTPEPTQEPSAEPAMADTEESAAAVSVPAAVQRVIVLDPGHGKSSSQMTSEEKLAYGWTQNSSGAWGEWRHWKSGTMWHDCLGSGCNGRAPSGGSCWYPIGNGDRDTEPAINLNNALSAKKYLEQMNYTVRMARSSNEENPSLSYRLKSCYPNSDTSQTPDAIAYVCIHSNAGGGSGSAYLALSSGYDHAYTAADYAGEGNALGRTINNKITSETSLSAYSGGCYTGQPDLILFHKSPVPVAYLEIGFFDNSSDLAILRSESDAIGKAIAEGINEYVTGKGL